MLSNGVDSLGSVQLEIFKNRLEKHLLMLIGQYRQHMLPWDRQMNSVSFGGAF